MSCQPVISDSISGKRITHFQVPVQEDGRRVWRNMEEFDTSDAGVHANWPHRFFAKIVESQNDIGAIQRL